MRKFSVMTSKSARLATGAVLVAVLAACGGGSNPPPPVVGSNLAVAINPTTGPAAVATILNQSVSFPAIPSLGTTEATTLTLSGSGTEPKFTITSGGKTATGNFKYGSCILDVVSSNFTGVLATGGVITQTACSFSFTMISQATVVPFIPPFTVDWGGVIGSGVATSYSFCVGPFGSVTAAATSANACGSGTQVGTVPVVTPTGTGSGG